MRKLLRLPFVPFALLAVGLMRLLWPLVKVRIGDIWSPRIGHMLGNMECYLCERDAGMHRGCFDLWYHRKPVSNTQAARMLARCLWIDRTGFVPLVDLCNRLFLGWEKHVCEPAQCDRDIYNLMEKHPVHLRFSPFDEARGEWTLKKLGVPPGAKFVCFIIRDAAYLPTLTYHKHRDSDPFTYIPAALELVKRGYYVIRMGAKVAEPFKVKHSKIIDYATSGARSDFMDVYLGAHCEFCVSNCTGFDAIPMVFRRPIVYVNQVPLEYLMTFVPRSLAIWKHHEKDGKRLTPREVFDLNAGQCMRAEEYEAAGIKLVDNTPQEIIDVVLEMVDTVEGRAGCSPECLAGHHSGYEVLHIQPMQTFWRDFPRSISPYNAKPLHGEFRLRIGREFLRGYQ